MDISVYHLKKLPSTHHFLATLYSKILLGSQVIPSSWCQARMKLVFKGGDPGDPANFRPIALTSVLGKLFNKILALRLGSFLIYNKIIDTSLQKGFLTDINGVMEHIFSLTAIVYSATHYNRPLALTFLDIKNAFGSVSHSLISDMMEYVKLPTEFCCYVNNMYSQLTAYVSTKAWSTNIFRITRGVFQGDTLSPLIFLLSFTPIIQAANQLSTLGFRVCLPSNSDSQEDPPRAGSYIYVLWDVQDSSEPQGWYLAKVTDISKSNVVTLCYRKDKSTEEIPLCEMKWRSAKGNGKWFLPSASCDPVRLSTIHKLKAFADDLTVISSSKEDHQSALTKINSYCLDLGLTLKPSKCVSFVFDGKRANKSATFSIGDGESSNIFVKPTKFLGMVCGHTATSTRCIAGKQLLADFSTCLDKLDRCPIRGEFKTWIYKRFLVQSFQFQMSVNAIPSGIIRNMQALGLRKLKRWLGVTRSSTAAILHHPSVLGIPALDDFSLKSKLIFLAAVSSSKDPFINEINSLISENHFCYSRRIPAMAQTLLQLTRQSVNTLVEDLNNSKVDSPRVKKYFKRCYLSEFRKAIIRKWDTNLNKLSVQNKFLDVSRLEHSNRVWNRIMAGLPAGQLSFLLRAGSDTLPTPLNLKRWKIQTDSKCSLCGCNLPTVHHILSGCPIALDQGRYSWRHDSALSVLFNGLKNLLHDVKQLVIYADLPNCRAEENPPLTVPPAIVCTCSRPDIVVVESSQVVVLIELTVPFNSPEALEYARRFKANKENYQVLLSDLNFNGYQSELITIEIGALGHWLPRSLSAIRKVFPSLAKEDVKLLLDRASKVVISSSQIIFNARHSDAWSASRPLLT